MSNLCSLFSPSLIFHGHKNWGGARWNVPLRFLQFSTKIVCTVVPPRILNFESLLLRASPEFQTFLRPCCLQKEFISYAKAIILMMYRYDSTCFCLSQKTAYIENVIKDIEIGSCKKLSSFIDIEVKTNTSLKTYLLKRLT